MILDYFDSSMIFNTLRDYLADYLPFLDSFNHVAKITLECNIKVTIFEETNKPDMTDKKIAIVHLPNGRQIIYTNVPAVHEGDRNNYQLVDSIIFSPEDLTVTYQEDGNTVTKCWINTPVEIEMW